MSSVHSALLNTALCVSSIDISLARDSRKTIRFIKLTKNGEALRDIQTILRAGGTYRKEFVPPLVVESDDHIVVSAHCSSRFQKRFDVVIDVNLRDVECMRDDQRTKSYRKRTRNVEVVVVGYQRISQASGVVSQTVVSQTSGGLVATTTELMHACAQFRILIIGNSGVGKSALIKKMFGVKEVRASKTARGDARIDQEFVSPMNERFVVHDSLGFEAGDERNMKIVEEFAKGRQAMPRLEDRLHAIWLCVETPYSGGRLVEVGVEQFLQRQHDIIGDIPLVVVLTKIDLLDIHLDLNPPDNATPAAYRSQYLDEHCMKFLREAAGHDVTFVAVSAEEGHSESLSKLFMTTGQKMAINGVDEAPRAMASIAQRVSITEKLELSIAVGKKKYWQMLLKSPFFRGHTLKECLEVIRKDIITVWNFYDPDQCLMDDKLIGALLRTDNLGDHSTTQSTTASFAGLLTSSLELAKNRSASGEITSTVADSVASVTIAVLHTTYEAYQEAKNDVKIFMAYIVDLICVMQAIFLIAPDGRVTPETVALVLQAYEVPRKVVHKFVDGFDGKRGVHPEGRDEVLEKIVGLIWRHSVPDHETRNLRQRVGR